MEVLGFLVYIGAFGFVLILSAIGFDWMDSR